MLVLGLNRLKAINHAGGHAAGDAQLGVSVEEFTPRLEQLETLRGVLGEGLALIRRSWRLSWP